MKRYNFESLETFLWLKYRQQDRCQFNEKLSCSKITSSALEAWCQTHNSCLGLQCPSLLYKGKCFKYLLVMANGYYALWRRLSSVFGSEMIKPDSLLAVSLQLLVVF